MIKAISGTDRAPFGYQVLGDRRGKRVSQFPIGPATTADRRQQFSFWRPPLQ
jgi:hypothetical protein